MPRCPCSQNCVMCFAYPSYVCFFPSSLTAESLGVSAQIGAGAVRGGPESVLRGFHEGSTSRVVGHQISTVFCKGCGMVRPEGSNVSCARRLKSHPSSKLRAQKIALLMCGTLKQNRNIFQHVFNVTCSLAQTTLPEMLALWDSQCGRVIAWYY